MPAKELFHVGDDALQSGTAFVSWDPTGTLLACCGKSRKVLLYSRSSKLVGEVPLPLKGNVLSMEWDYEGAVLAILQAESSVLTLYEVHTKRVEQLDVKLKDVSYITWSSSTPHLAIGTAKGNLLIYNRKTMRKYPVIGKHSKKIVCGSWSASEGTRLALGSDDRELTISSSEGDLLFQSTVSAEPREMLFGPSGQQMSVNLGKSLLLFDIVQKGQPFELLFQAKYGTIVAHTWFGDGYIALGFSEGYFAVVSTHRKEMASEVFGCKVSDSIAGLRFSHSLQRAALLCEDGVRFVDVSDSTSYGVMESEFISIPRIKYGLLQTSSWSSDGQLLAVGTADGHMLLYLTSIPLVVASNPVNETIAFRSSLREVTVSDSSRKKRVLPFDMEVSMLAVDEQWIAVVANHVVVLANHTVEGGKAVSKTEHMASVTTLQLTSGFLGTLTSDRVLHVSQTGQKATSSSTSARTFEDVTCFRIVDDGILWYATGSKLNIYSLTENAVLAEYTPERPVRALWPCFDSTYGIFLDAANSMCLYAPSIDTVLNMDISGATASASYDVYFSSNNRFVVVGTSSVSVGVYVPVTIDGPLVTVMADNSKSALLQPLFLQGEALLCIHRSSRVVAPCKVDLLTTKEPRTLIALHQISRLTLGPNTEDPQLLDSLLQEAITLMDRGLVLRIARKAHNAAFLHRFAAVFGSSITGGVEVRELQGDFCVLRGDYEKAEGHYLRSGQANKALAMWLSLNQIENALRLASSPSLKEAMGQKDLETVWERYAEYCDMRGDTAKALEYYQKLSGTSQHMRNIAKCLVKLGDVRAAMTILKPHVESVEGAVAAMLEENGQLADAATLYEKAGMEDKAVVLYVQLRQFSRITIKPTTPQRILLAVAKHKETEGKMNDAFELYERAGDVMACCRLLDAAKDRDLNQTLVGRLLAQVRNRPIPEAAKAIAKYLARSGADPRGAIEFMVLARDYYAALEAAKLHNALDALFSFVSPKSSASHIDTDAVPMEIFAQIAKAYEDRSNRPSAARCYELCGNVSHALNLYLAESMVAEAIDLVGKHRDEPLVRTLVEYLSGERDGNPKDPQHIFALYLALGNYPQAAKTAAFIASKEQELGNYKRAHDVLRTTIKDLRAQRVHVSRELKSMLSLLHSYVLVKSAVKMQQHARAARLLLRVAKSISRFPAHVVPILTSTVIECQRANFKKSAYEYAVLLVRPEYRAQVNEQYKRKIEAIVRNAKKAETETDPDDEDEPTECYHCSALVPATKLDCASCRNTLAYCAASGKHLSARLPVTFCYKCRFPAFRQYLEEFLAADENSACPMCGEQIDRAMLEDITNLEEWIATEDGEMVNDKDAPSSEAATPRA